MACILGGALGTVLTWSIMGYIIESIGWAWAFYIPAFIAAAAAVLWLYVASDSPATHPRITFEEKTFIQKSQEGQKLQNKVMP